MDSSSNEKKTCSSARAAVMHSRSNEQSNEMGRGIWSWGWVGRSLLCPAWLLKAAHLSDTWRKDEDRRYLRAIARADGTACLTGVCPRGTSPVRARRFAKR